MDIVDIAILEEAITDNIGSITALTVAGFAVIGFFMAVRWIKRVAAQMG